MLKPNWKRFEKNLGTEARVDGSSTRWMEDNSVDWELLETQDLKALLAAPGPDCDISVSVNSFPGLVARRIKEKPNIVAIGYGIESQAVLALTTPLVLGRLAVKEVTEALSILFRAALQVAFRNGCRSLRCLLQCSEAQPEDTECAQRTALTLEDFSCLARIGEWRREYRVRDSHNRFQLDREFETACERVTPERFRESQVQEEVKSLLESVLSMSSDLPGLPRPMPEDMMTSWLNRGMEILLFRSHSSPTGLCVYEKTYNTVSNEARSSVWLQYVGVSPECRQQGIARRLIQNLLKACMQEQPTMAVSVTADCTNIGAVRLYESLGFEQQTIQEVWIKHVEHQLR